MLKKISVEEKGSVIGNPAQKGKSQQVDQCYKLNMEIYILNPFVSISAISQTALTP